MFSFPVHAAVWGAAGEPNTLGVTQGVSRLTIGVNDEAGSVTFNAEEKAITLMRYVREHLENTERARREQHSGDA